MAVFVPTSLEELLTARAERPGLDLVAGGTDLVVEVNFGRHRLEDVASLSRVPELGGWRREGPAGPGGHLVLGSGLTYTEMLDPTLAELLPSLAQAARTVGSPQIRNAGTLGGNLGTASPAGDTLPVLAALEAEVLLGSAAGTRLVPLGEFVTGPKRTALAPDEVILAARVPVARGHQEFLKVGTRNAMVIAVCSVALVLDEQARQVRVGLGSVGPAPIRALEAERFAAEVVDWSTGRFSGGEADLRRFGELVGAAARPIDDHRSIASYRRRAVEVCARRALERTMSRQAA